MATTNSQSNRTLGKFDQFIEHLYTFYFDNRRGQYLVYALTFLVSVAFASIGILVFGRTEQSVVFDCAVLAVIFLVGLPIAYSLGLVYATVVAQPPAPIANPPANRHGSVA